MMRAIYQVTGADRFGFLQGLLTNDVLGLAQGDGIVYAALLTPQGKYLADMFVVAQGGALLLDIAAGLAPAAVQRLQMYRLRADVQIAPSGLALACGLGPAPLGAWPDPRHPALGWRHYGAGAGDGIPPKELAALRVAHVIPESGIELVPNDSYILEMGLDRLNGVSFRKGCYVGQEVTARMRHKTELKKTLLRVAVQGEAAPGTPVLAAGGRVVGTLYTQHAGQALAHLRLDWAQEPMQAAGAHLQLLPAS
jgi:tRNA-modifying protein YgfZ